MAELRSEMERQMAKEVETRVTKWVTVAITVLITVAITFVVALIVLKLVWAWVIPDLFPGAVNDGLIVGDLTWLAAAKLAVLAALLGGVSPALAEAAKANRE